MANVSSAINGIFYRETVTMETNRENTVHEVEGIYRLRELIRRTRRERDCDAKQQKQETANWGKPLVGRTRREIAV
jgi:hypothetical protein